MHVADPAGDPRAALAALFPPGEAVPEVAEVPEGELDAWIARGLPCVVRGHPEVVAARGAFSVEALRAAAGDREITVEHRHRWNPERRTLSATAYLEELEETEFYWRQVSLPSLGMEPPPLPRPRSGRGDVVFIDHAWIGPGGTVQTFHQDNHDELVVNHNLFMQFHGAKYVALASPADSGLFHAFPLVAGSLRHSSASPRDAAVRAACGTLAHAVLGPGDVIHVPPRYWHYVEGLAPGISVSRWWFAGRVAETLYLAAQGRARPGREGALGAGSWRQDVSEIGGDAVLTDYLRRLPPAKGYTIVLALMRAYGADAVTLARPGER